MPRAKKEKTIKCILSQENVISENSDAARQLTEGSQFGIVMDNQRVQFSLIEGYYLVDKGKISIYDLKSHKLTAEEYLRKAKKTDKNFKVRCAVYSDLRERGYTVKTALKFGADFRVYDRGVKPGEDHAKWIVYPVHESSYLTWYEFAAKNRVAHSTKKRLLLGIVDDENDVTYYEVKWTKP
jgi:tRNA-intron endonuclease